MLSKKGHVGIILGGRGGHGPFASPKSAYDLRYIRCVAYIARVALETPPES